MPTSPSRHHALRLPLLVLALLALGAAIAWMAVEAPAADVAAGDPTDEATAALERARRAYASAGAFAETLAFTLELPDGRRSERRQRYGVSADGSAFLELGPGGGEGLVAVARDGRLVAVWSHIGGRYAEAAYDGDLAAALGRLEAERVQIAAPPAMVAAQGGDAAAFREALRFGILSGPLELSLAAPGELVVAAANGSTRLGLDPTSGRFSTVRFVLGAGDDAVRAAGTFAYRADGAALPALPDLAGRSAVASLPALEAAEYPLGEPAPAVELPALDGGTVALADLRGEVVVLDFWATWCVPCWQTLEATEELAAWAAGSGLPVRVWAVDTLERAGSAAEQAERARRFLAGRDLDLPVLLDPDDAAFAAFHHPGLPSLVVVDREGRLAAYHSGASDDLAETVRREVLELLD